jgi:hypothetical protein
VGYFQIALSFLSSNNRCALLVRLTTACCELLTTAAFCDRADEYSSVVCHVTHFLGSLAFSVVGFMVVVPAP